MKDDPSQRNHIYVDCLQSQCHVEGVKLRVAGLEWDGVPADPGSEL